MNAKMFKLIEDAFNAATHNGPDDDEHTNDTTLLTNTVEKLCDLIAEGDRHARSIGYENWGEWKHIHEREEEARREERLERRRNDPTIEERENEALRRLLEAGKTARLGTHKACPHNKEM